MEEQILGDLLLEGVLQLLVPLEEEVECILQVLIAVLEHFVVL